MIYRAIWCLSTVKPPTRAPDHGPDGNSAGDPGGSARQLGYKSVKFINRLLVGQFERNIAVLSEQP